MPIRRCCKSHVSPLVDNEVLFSFFVFSPIFSSFFAQRELLVTVMCLYTSPVLPVQMRNTNALTTCIYIIPRRDLLLRYWVSAATANRYTSHNHSVDHKTSAVSGPTFPVIRKMLGMFDF